jgi:hypothetical protein
MATILREFQKKYNLSFINANKNRLEKTINEFSQVLLNETRDIDYIRELAYESEQSLKNKFYNLTRH